MAQFYLLNSFLFGTRQRWAGELVSDVSEDVVALRAAGAILWSAGDANVANAAALAISLRRRGGSPAACTAAMAAAVDWSNGQNVGRAIFGTGTDGMCVFDGVKTFPFATFSNGEYILTRDVFLDNGSTNLVGTTVDTASFKLFCSGTFYNYGVIENDGNDAVGSTGGASTRGSGSMGIGMSGGNGASNGNGNSGGTPSAINQINDASAAGGAGGNAGVRTGGAGGTYTGGALGDGGANYLTAYLTDMTFNASTNGVQATSDTIGGGAGGGGGASDALTSTGGGGGGGGGVLLLSILDLVNYGTISANGGKGANGAGTAGNAGGGGGGGGGMIFLLARYRSGSGVVIANGGAPGLGFGSGLAGIVGNLGHINFSFV